MRRVLLVISFLLCARVGFSQFFPYPAQRVTQGSGAPAAGLCNTSDEVGKVYIRNDTAATTGSFYVCANTGVATYAWQLTNAGAASATIASTTNLIEGDGAGNGVSSGIAASTVVKGAAGLTTTGCVPYQNGTTGTLTCSTAFSLVSGGARLQGQNDSAEVDVRYYTGVAAHGYIDTGSSGSNFRVVNRDGTANTLVSWQWVQDGSQTTDVWQSLASDGTTVQAKLDVKGAFTAAGYMASGGTKFTISGCSAGTTVGGATAGTFTLGADTCDVVITMNGATGLTAPTGWSCWASDQTDQTVLIQQKSSTTTTATLAIPAAAGTTDVIRFGCIGY